MRLLLAVLAAASLLAIPASAQAVSTATNVRIGNHGTFVRTAVDFPAGGLRWSNYVVRDDNPGDGRAVYWVRCAILQVHPRFTQTLRRSAYGLTVRIRREDDRVLGCPFLRIELLSHPGTFAAMSYESHRGRRFVIDSWRPWDYARP